MAEGKKSYRRFSLSQRVQHWVMTLSFTVLAVTGLPQRYALAGWAEGMIAGLGGIEAVRVIHRVAAVVFIVVTLFHFMALAYWVWVKRVRMTILPGLKDVTDMLDAIRYNLGLARREPKLPRYNFAEKVEYWSLIWGSVLMIVTGFMLWNPIATASFLPGEFIPAAKTAHSAEALLAVLAVIIWHFYSVHVKTFNRSMFTGELTREQMEAEHEGYLEELERGVVPAPVSREAKRRRERAFLPVAAGVSLVMGIGLYMFVTFEQTALTTVPPAETVQAFVPATATPTLTPTATPIPTATAVATATAVGGETNPGTGAGAGELASAPVIPHGLEGFGECLQCHAAGGVVPYPAGHAVYGANTCQVCHTTQGPGPVPGMVQHELEGRENCLMCHGLDLLPESHRAADFDSAECLQCHTAGGPLEAEATPAGGGTVAAAAGSVSFASDIEPLLAAQCGTCHGETALGGLQVTAYQSLLAGGENGPVILPGSPDESLIVVQMRGEHPARLSGDDLQKLIDWIAAGAEDN
jgi:formate dehydrogenase gamma subunit